MLFSIKTLHNFGVCRYLELKRYSTFAFIVTQNLNVIQVLRLSLFRIVLIPIKFINNK